MRGLRSLTLYVFISGLCCCFGRDYHLSSASNDRYVEEFKLWMSTHGVTFSTKGEFRRRLAIFSQNSAFINEHNSVNGASSSYILGHNEFSHLSWEEFKESHLGYSRRSSPSVKNDAVQTSPTKVVHNQHGKHIAVSLRKLGADLPDEVDWAAAGAVAPVQNQGMCGSCWAFSAIGAMEGAYYLQTQQLVKFSEEQLVDCDREEKGCLGGDMAQAFDWIKDNGGVCDEDDYPYSGLWPPLKTCKVACNAVPGTAVSGWGQAEPTNEGLMVAVTQQPVAIAIEADQPAFQFYKSGVFTATCGNKLDHGVLLVGYGTSDEGTDYWKVKNSWGKTWGLDGYILLERAEEEEPEGGECGILMEAVYPVLETALVLETMPQPKDDGALLLSSLVVDRPEGFESSAVAVDCGGGSSSIVFSTVDVSPASPSRGSPVSLSAKGTLTKPMSSGTISLGVKLGSSSVYSHEGSLCGVTEAKLPLGLGKINMHGLDCPAIPGQVSYSLELTLPSIAPPGDYDISLSGTDDSSTLAMCLDVKLKL